MKKIRFRQSREALILDILLVPFGVIYSVLLQGFPETVRELKNLPYRYKTGWGRTGWFLKQVIF